MRLEVTLPIVSAREGLVAALASVPLDARWRRGRDGDRRGVRTTRGMGRRMQGTVGVSGISGMLHRRAPGVAVRPRVLRGVRVAPVVLRLLNRIARWRLGVAVGLENRIADGPGPGNDGLWPWAV